MTTLPRRFIVQLIRCHHTSYERNWHMRETQVCCYPRKDLLQHLCTVMGEYHVTEKCVTQLLENDLNACGGFSTILHSQGSSE